MPVVGWHELAKDWLGMDPPTSPAKVRGHGSYEGFFEQVKKLHNETDKYVLVIIYGSHFEKAYFARGIENCLADLAGAKDFARSFSLIIEKNLVMLDNIVACPDIDGVLLGSDWGTQLDLIMSPDTWQEIIRPGEQKEYDLIHAYGKDVWIHSCGNVEKIIPSDRDGRDAPRSAGSDGHRPAEEGFRGQADVVGRAQHPEDPALRHGGRSPQGDDPGAGYDVEGRRLHPLAVAGNPGGRPTGEHHGVDRGRSPGKGKEGMKNAGDFNLGLDRLDAGAERTRSISAENPTGAKGRGGMAVPDLNNLDLPHCAAAQDLGKGWKVRPFLKPKAGETVTLMDVDGPGVIQHIWLATETRWQGNGRGCILRFYWDGEETPSVEVPMTDSFAGA